MTTRVSDSQASGFYLSAQIMPLWDTWRILQPLTPLILSSCGTSPDLPQPSPNPLLLLWLHAENGDTDVGYFVRPSLGEWAQASVVPGCSSEVFHHIPFLSSFSPALSSVGPIHIFLEVPQYQSFLPSPSDSLPLPQLELLSLVWRQGGLVLCLVLQICHFLLESFLCRSVLSCWPWPVDTPWSTSVRQKPKS